MRHYETVSVQDLKDGHTYLKQALLDGVPRTLEFDLKQTMFNIEKELIIKFFYDQDNVERLAGLGLITDLDSLKLYNSNGDIRFGFARTLYTKLKDK